MSPAAGVGADQHPPPQAAGQLRQGQPGGFDVVSCSVRASVACPQQDCQRLPGALSAVISEDRQRVMAFSELNDQGFPVPGWRSELR
jgi:hypothetical protein